MAEPLDVCKKPSAFVSFQVSFRLFTYLVVMMRPKSSLNMSIAIVVILSFT